MKGRHTGPKCTSAKRMAGKAPAASEPAFYGLVEKAFQDSSYIFLLVMPFLTSSDALRCPCS